LSSFKCGHDAPTYGLIDSIISASGTPYSALHDVDANKPSGSIKIRVKTYGHTLMLARERLEDGSEKRRELERSLVAKKLELLENIQRQVSAQRGATDIDLQRRIEQQRARVSELTPASTKVRPAALAVLQ
jgi:hypothetical protein